MNRQLSLLTLALVCLTLVSGDGSSPPRNTPGVRVSNATPMALSSCDAPELFEQPLQHMSQEEHAAFQARWDRLNADFEELQAAEPDVFAGQRWTKQLRAAFPPEPAPGQLPPAVVADFVAADAPPAAVQPAQLPAAPELTEAELKGCEQRAIWLHLTLKTMQRQGTYPRSAIVPSPQALVPAVINERRRLAWPWMQAQAKAKQDLKKLIEAQERAAAAAQDLQ